MFLNAPALLKVIITFTFVLALNRFGLHLGLSLLVCAFSMLLWFGNALGESLQIVFNGAFNKECLLLLIVVFQILALTLLMTRTGMMQQMISSVKSIVPSRRMAMAMLPAMIGILPMPGGAAVSAPMVDAADEDNHLEPLQKTVINYWFRHSWEYWLPLYPGVLLVAEISGLSLKTIALLHVPFTFVSLISGVFFLLLPLKLGPQKGKKSHRQYKELIQSLSPILILLVLWLILGSVLKKLNSKYIPMILALVGAFIWLQIWKKPDRKTWFDVLRSKKNWLILVVVIGVKVFSTALESRTPGGDKIVNLIRENLDNLHIPSILVLMIMPFISGIVTGLAYGFVGASFPIVMSLVGENPSASQVMSYVVIAYGFGYIGMMMSPVHVCFVVTNEYFKTRITQAYRKLWGPMLAVLVASVIIGFIVARAGGHSIF
ncbi:DUF401 family protein [Candidatus Sumerlaeota bacterium]|nr:DUF401 family protein [Candidatus Sumerlaeota bacterium]